MKTIQLAVYSDGTHCGIEGTTCRFLQRIGDKEASCIIFRNQFVPYEGASTKRYEGCFMAELEGAQ